MTIQVKCSVAYQFSDRLVCIEMLRRFSLYGFLKNQRYFEPFFILLMLDRGFSFTMIGSLVAYRELLVNGLEIPSGAIADRWGRRRAMILSFSAYVISFLVFAAARSVFGFIVAFSLFAIGEAFRTGTHKAMIFSWLEQSGRLDERTQVYGYTRSWSKIGSAVSALIASGIVLITNGYQYVFGLAVIPYGLAIINFLGYPRSLDRHTSARPSLLTQLRRSLRSATRNPKLRALVFESTTFEGTFAASKDYLQPLLMATAATAFAQLSVSSTQKSALLIGPIFSVLFIIAAFCSRNAYRFVELSGNHQQAAQRLWFAAMALYAVIAITSYLHVSWLTIIAFLALFAGQNLWRPILITRFDQSSDTKEAATLLSVESQAKRIGTALVAPVLGLAVDATAGPDSASNLWPVGAIGLLLTLLGWRSGRAQSLRNDNPGSTPLAR